MNFTKKIKESGEDLYDRLWVRKKIRDEYKKISNPKYQEVVNRYQLNKEQKDSIDNFYESYYGKKIPYDWHRYYSWHSGIFNPQYFPDLLLQPCFEHYLNFNRAYAEVFEDKNVIPYIAKAANIIMPKTIISKTCGVFRDKDNQILKGKTINDYIANSGPLFCKPSTVTCGGYGCFSVNFQNGYDVKSGKKAIDIINELGEEFVIQELIKCHPSISCLYPKAVNTFRVITYRWEGKFLHMPVFMRIAQGGAEVDNGAAGGLFVGVKDNGLCTERAVSHSSVFYVHPDTGTAFKNHQIKSFPSVIESALTMHKMIPELGMIYWDFTINEDGLPVLIECNIRNGTVYAIEMTHGMSPFGEKTADILSWIKEMGILSSSTRKLHVF